MIWCNLLLINENSGDDLLQIAIKEWKFQSFLLRFFFPKWSCSKETNTILSRQKRLNLNHNTFRRRHRDKTQNTKMYYYYKDIYDAFAFFWFKHDKVMAQNALYQNSLCRIKIFINSIKNYLLIKNLIVWLDPNLTACTIQVEFDDFFFTYFLEEFSLWKHL